jgi:hypothetical protein
VGGREERRRRLLRSRAAVERPARLWAEDLGRGGHFEGRRFVFAAEDVSGLCRARFPEGFVVTS